GRQGGRKFEIRRFVRQGAGVREHGRNRASNARKRRVGRGRSRTEADRRTEEARQSRRRRLHRAEKAGGELPERNRGAGSDGRQGLPKCDKVLQGSTARSAKAGSRSDHGIPAGDGLSEFESATANGRILARGAGHYFQGSDAAASDAAQDLSAQIDRELPASGLRH